MLQHPQINMFKKILNTVYYNIYNMSGNKDNVNWLFALLFMMQSYGLMGLLFFALGIFQVMDGLIFIICSLLLWIPIALIWYRYINRNKQEILVNDEEYAGFGKCILSIIYVVLSILLLPIVAYIFI